MTLDIDRDRASALGVTAGQVEDALYSAFGNRQVSTIYSPKNDYQVIMELLPEYQRDPNAIHLVAVRSSNGRLVRLDAVTRPKDTVGALQVNALWAAALGHDLVRHSAGRFTGRGGHAN